MFKRCIVRVDREAIWNVIQLYRIGVKLLKLIKNLYNEDKASVIGEIELNGFQQEKT